MSSNNVFAASRTNDGHGPEFIRGELFHAPRKHHRAPVAREVIAAELFDATATPGHRSAPGLKQLTDDARFVWEQNHRAVERMWAATREARWDSWGTVESVRVTGPLCSVCDLPDWECDLLGSCENERVEAERERVAVLTQNYEYQQAVAAHAYANPTPTKEIDMTTLIAAHRTQLTFGEQESFTRMVLQGAKPQDAIRALQQRRGNRHDVGNVQRDAAKRHTAFSVCG